MESTTDTAVGHSQLASGEGASPSRGAVFLYAVAAATFFGAINAIQIQSTANGQGSWGSALTHALLVWYLFLPIVPLGIVLAKKLPATREHRYRNTCIHALVALAIGAIHPFAFILAYSLVTQPRWAYVVAKSLLPYVHFWYMQDLLMAVLAYAMTAFATHAYVYYRSYQQGKLKAAQLEAQLANANLSALKMQIHPHFLFNALHSISSLQMVDGEAAQKMTALLGDFLRMTLRDANQDEVPLRQELEFLERYLAIERMRFGDRLKFSVEAKPETLDAVVPQLILQPIVENAVRHGIAPYGCGGEIAVRAVRIGGRLLLTVQDSGPGILDDELKATSPLGLGIPNTRARLSQLYGAAQSLSLDNLPGGGFRVSIELPYRIANENIATADEQSSHTYADR